MDRSIYLGLAIHNHQPVGNFDFVFAEAYDKAYRPLVDLLEKHPNIKMTLHYSGPLRDWLFRERPDFLPRIAALAARGQVETMTGGYYEPILVSIPEEDRRGQIRKMTRAVEEDFGYPAVGAWLAERVWEPSLAKTLAQAGVAYSVVDDAHFVHAGLRDEIFGYYVTEDEGYPLKVFASSQHLRYAIPWKDVSQVIDWLRENTSADGQRIAVMGDDGEKFGLWPTTYEHVWTRGWMEEFFEAIEERQDWLKTVTLAEYAERFPAAGRIYLPTASYEEMMEWALPATLATQLEEVVQRLRAEGRPEVLAFVRGGQWRNFLAKYPEVNDLHKKMLRVHQQVHSMLPSPMREMALNQLWQGQCNCPYWHGVFGGIYLPHIRSANYQHLLAAEELADRVLRGEGDWIEVETTDLRRDTGSVLIVSGSRMNLYFDLRAGGSLFEWDWRAKEFNLLNTISRRPEGYHAKLRVAGAASQPDHAVTIHELTRTKEVGLEALLRYDAYRRTAFIDHLFSPETTLEEFLSGAYREQGDFVDQPYQSEIESHEKAMSITLWREGQLGEGFSVPLRIEKRFELMVDRTELPVSYRLQNLGAKPIRARFAVELNLALLSGHAPGAYYRIPGIAPDVAHLNSVGESEAIREFGLLNEHLGMEIAIAVSPAARLWRLPLETISSSEGGIERVYQASCLLLSWEVSLEPDQLWEGALRLSLVDTSGG